MKRLIYAADPCFDLAEEPRSFALLNENRTALRNAGRFASRVYDAIDEACCFGHVRFHELVPHGNRKAEMAPKEHRHINQATPHWRRQLAKGVGLRRSSSREAVRCRRELAMMLASGGRRRPAFLG